MGQRRGLRVLPAWLFFGLELLEVELTRSMLRRVVGLTDLLDGHPVLFEIRLARRVIIREAHWRSGLVDSATIHVKLTVDLAGSVLRNLRDFELLILNLHFVLDDHVSLART